ncbi:hypothetical protein BDN71DRAFT_863328 [Pleurotus eryngii]|uniref:Uncharacterized protein n=1 Tax=Pleurotus eryngii TaxID=5323 RepID=A0A9P6A1P4_PLEER|nr:hypothetical protein BDN71DRAFT_863328 [Pleurotus eryngii]
MSRFPNGSRVTRLDHALWRRSGRTHQVGDGVRFIRDPKDELEAYSKAAAKGSPAEPRFPLAISIPSILLAVCGLLDKKRTQPSRSIPRQDIRDRISCFTVGACISGADRNASILCMFGWYRHACVCIIYLPTSPNVLEDPWGDQRWTLREFFAASRVKCFGSDCRNLDDDRRAVSFDACRIKTIYLPLSTAIFQQSQAM